MRHEKFIIRAVPGGFTTSPADPSGCPLLEKLYCGPVPERVETDDPLPKFVRHIRSVAKNEGVVAVVCGDIARAPTVVLRESRRAQRSPKPRRGWINHLTDVATRLYEVNLAGPRGQPLAEARDEDVREIVRRVSHRVYKYTDCGAWLAVIEAGEFDPAVGRRPARHPNGALLGVVLGSIVEGIDATTDTHELRFPFTEKQFWVALQAVEEEARELWNNTHGCATCAKHWREVGAHGADLDGGDGCTPVWDECPDCGGNGGII